jgi:DNA-binding XRE family transcriptional regulator
MPSRAELVWVDRTDVLHRDTEHALLYRVRNADNVIIYVGMTLSELGRRFGSHHHPQSSWWEEAATVESCTVSRQEARALEGAEIHSWHPAGNRQCRECGGIRKKPQSRDYINVPRKRTSGIEINATAFRAARIQSMMTRQDLADKVNADCQDLLPGGTTRDSISKYERGVRRPRPAVVKAIAKVLGCDPNSLVRQPDITV